MEKKQLKRIIEDLDSLSTDLYVAKTTIDKRRIEKRIREAKNAIADYAHNLPSEVKAYLEENVGVNALHFQWADGDIGNCIIALGNWLKTLPEEE